MHQNMSLNLEDYIFKIDDFLDRPTCKIIINKISKLNWEKHKYYDQIENTYTSYDNDLSVIHAPNIEEIKILNKKLSYAIDMYISRLNFTWYGKYSNYSGVRLNRYDKSTCMRVHCDHIHSLFDGINRGIPVLTLLGSLNNNYKGGELIMFDQKTLELNAGSLVIFPSNFLFPHEIKPIISGIRYSYVSWCW